MGNCGKKIQQVLFKNREGINTISCPQCNLLIVEEEKNIHLQNCLFKNQNQDHVNSQQQQPQNIQINNQVIHQINQQQNNIPLKTQQTISNKDNFYWIKVPLDNSGTKFKWEKRTYTELNIQNLKGINSEQASKLDFEEKQQWFRYHVEKLRIPWQQGADWMKIYQDNVLLTSLAEIQNVNLHKEVKIKIEGDKVQDAGGLLREWVHLVFKEILDPNTGLFIMAETNDVTYKINNEADIDQHVLDCFALVGKILGKSIFERMQVNAYFDRTIIKQILEQEVTIDDIFYYDKNFFNSWQFLLNTELKEDDIVDSFCIYKSNNFTGEMKMHELIPGGQDIFVNNTNRQEYVKKCIEYYTVKSVQPFIDSIKQGFYQVIPKNLIKIFNCEEFEMIINGLPFINVDDWEQNTVYKGTYHAKHQNIKWFWKVLYNFDQQQLSDFLRYCTGSSRTPVEGFKKLESNRGNFAKFCIEQINYDPLNPYPRSHTCFNRLELPTYQSYEQTEQFLKSIIKNDFDGVFGME